MEKKQIPRKWAGRKTTEQEEAEISKVQESMKERTKDPVSWLEAKHVYFEAVKKGTVKVLMSSIDGPMKQMNEKIEAQKKYAATQGLTMGGFAPNTGICFACRRQIYDAISLDKASTELITGCPYCCRSYCD